MAAISFDTAHLPALEPTPEPTQEGDPLAFDHLFGRNIPRLVAFIRAKVGGVVAARESATDLAQSVCREAWQDLDRFDFRGEEEFRNWLFVRASRKICHRHRWHHRHRRDVDRETPVPTNVEGSGSPDFASLATPSRHARAQEDVSRIAAALESLPADQREAIALTRVAQLSYTEAARQMGRSEASLRGLVMRGLSKLAALLESEEGAL